MRRAVVHIVDLETQLSSSESQLPHRLPAMHLVQRLSDGAPGFLDGHSFGRPINELNLVGAPGSDQGKGHHEKDGGKTSRIHASLFRITPQDLKLAFHRRYLSLAAEASFASGSQARRLLSPPPAYRCPPISYFSEGVLEMAQGVPSSLAILG